MPSIYEQLYGTYKQRYEGAMSKQAIQSKCVEKWADLKKHHKGDNLTRAASEEIVRLKQEIYQLSAKRRSYFAQACRSTNSQPDTKGQEKNVENGNEAAAPVDVVHDGDPKPAPPKGKVAAAVCSDDDSDNNPDDPGLSVSTKAPKPRQDLLRKEITVLESELNSLVTKRDTIGVEKEDHVKIIKTRKALDEKKKLLNKQITKAKNQKAFRERTKQKLILLQQNCGSQVKTLRTEAGRPRLEDSKPGLLKAICDIALYSGSAADRRRSEQVRACKTLDDLTKELSDLGYTLSRSATYLRLLPRSSDTKEGKRHVQTVPVKLCRAQNDLHRQHADQRFCKATIYGLKELASVLGPEQVAFTSHDDKAEVPLGITAAKTQAPMLMHLEYKVSLPDHDFAPAPRHKLTPSVYAGMVIREDSMGQVNAVTSGPTYVALRSAKHSSSNAATHATDLETMLSLPDFQPIFKGKDGEMKPVHMISVDGGPDENPRYKKVIQFAIYHFKKRNLDAVFVFTNAPGLSAYNDVERRMAGFSKEMAGLILKHDHYGSHLDHNGKTIDVELERKNFQHAGESLAEIWSNMVIDGHNVTAQYISSEPMQEPEPVSANWYANHVRESQYLVQIVKCDDRNCCSALRSNIRQILYQRFLPAPYPFRQNPFGIPAPVDAKEEKFPSLLFQQSLSLRPDYDQTKEVPYDLYCPSLRDEIPKRTCQTCGLYFASKSSLQSHRKGVHGADKEPSRITPLKVLSRRPGELLCVINNDCTEWIDVEDVDDDPPRQLDEAAEEAPIIKDVGEWLARGKNFEEEMS